jgi:spermidine/putrescine transport system substrate-binding protein
VSVDDLRDTASQVARGRVTRREFMVRAAAAGLSVGAAAALLEACGGGSTTTSASPSMTLDTTKPANLYLYNWQNEIAPENKTKFKQETGVKIVETYYDDNEMLIAKLKGGARGYDLIVPSGYAVSILAKTGMLEPLDMSLIPGFTNLNAKFQKPAYDPGTDGVKYSVPWLWGTAGIAVRTDKLGGAVDVNAPSWQVLWEKAYKGQIDMLNDERETLGAALKLLGFSLNSTDQAQLDQATQKLIEQKPLVRAYDSLNMKRNIVAGVPLVHTWNGDAGLAADALGADKVFYGLPGEGYTIWVDNLAIPVGAKSPYWAHKFIDFMCQPQNAADLVNYVQYLSPNDAATPYVDKAIIANTPTGDVLARGEFQDDLGAFETQWGQAWQQVKSA